MSCCCISRPVSSSALTHMEWNWTLIIIITVCLYFLPLLLFTVCFFSLSLPSSLPPSFPSGLFLSSFFFHSFLLSCICLFTPFFSLHRIFFLYLLPFSPPSLHSCLLCAYLYSSFLPSFILPSITFTSLSTESQGSYRFFIIKFEDFQGFFKH